MEINGEELSSEVHTVTRETVIQKMRSVYDPETEKITNEISRGLCSVCGKPLFDENTVLCCFEDLMCTPCAILFKGNSICRNHVEIHLGSKDEAFVLISIGFGLNKKETRKITGLSEDTVIAARDMLVGRGYVKIKSLGLVGNSVKITELGSEVVQTLVTSYRSDLDFKKFLENIGWDKNVGTRPEQK